MKQISILLLVLVASLVVSVPVIEESRLNAQACDTTEAGCDGASEASSEVQPIGEELEADCVDGLESENCGITRWIHIFTNGLSVLFGIVAIVMLAYAGIQYTTARDNPQQAAAAKERIRNVIIAIVAYVLLYAFLQYVIPGGVSL